MVAVVASAPAKVILVGEHFVVRGSGAIVAAIGRRVRVRVEESREGVEIESSLFKVKASPQDLEEPRNMPSEVLPFITLLKQLSRMGYSIIPHRAVIESGIPVAAGLGSSASTAVAYALAYTALHGDPLKGERLFEAAMAAERIAHENPSGVDVAAAIEGGFLYYRRGERPRRITSGLRGVELIVADTGVKRRTSDVVRSVIETADALGEAGRLIYMAGEKVVGLALEALERGDAEKLGLAMNASHGLLSALGASSLEVDMLVNALRRAGALGAKLTG
ncbi:MAG: mevalonate kinase, partial [Desulfurococcales archaeon]|nr:mevalonate kinase [Desulfurococcales archaeon]